MSIREKVVLITGATGVLGRPLTEAFASSGARLALVVPRQDGVHPMERELLERGISAFVIPCDLRYEEDVVRMVHRVIHRFGRVDVVVNAAAVMGPRESIEDYPIDPWRNVLATNVTGAFLVCREVLPWMRRQGGGCILNVTTGLRKPSGFAWGACQVSHHAVEGLTRLLASELKGTGIRVNGVDVSAAPADASQSADGVSWVGAFLALADESSAPSGQTIIVSQLTRPAASV